MVPEPPPPYHEAVSSDGQPPSPNGVGFGQVPYPVDPPPVTTQPVVTPYGVVVEESAAPPVAVVGTAAAPPHDGKRKRHRHDRTSDWCFWCYCGPGCDCGDCCDCDCGDCGDCDCGDCDILECLCCFCN
ncbi:uncharacterized protein LOC144904641 [Branchiostoma floridae x Branchiostoma belcheri]